MVMVFQYYRVTNWKVTLEQHKTATKHGSVYVCYVRKNTNRHLKLKFVLAALFGLAIANQARHYGRCK